MAPTTQHHFKLWQEARTRFSNQIKELSAEDLRRKVPPFPNSAGFLIRHIAEVELLFAKNVFGARDVKVIAKTVIAKKDTGEWTDPEALKEYLTSAGESLGAIIREQSETDWETEITTPQFGTKTRAEALGRIVSHTAYHAGQIALVLKYGTA